MERETGIAFLLWVLEQGNEICLSFWIFFWNETPDIYYHLHFHHVWQYQDGLLHEKLSGGIQILLLIDFYSDLHHRYSQGLEVFVLLHHPLPL